MSGNKSFWGVVVLVAMQVFGQGVVWELLWASGLKDVRIMSALWWAWTIAQVVVAIPVGLHLVRWGRSRTARSRAADFLPAAWHEGRRSTESGGWMKSPPSTSIRTA